MTLEPMDLTTNLESRLDEMGRAGQRPVPPAFLAAVRGRRVKVVAGRVTFALATAAAVILAVAMAFNGGKPKTVQPGPTPKLVDLPIPQSIATLRRDMLTDLMAQKPADSSGGDAVRVGDRGAAAKLMSRE